MAALLRGGSAPSRSHHPRAGQTASVGERAPCLLLPPSASLTDGPVPWSRLCTTIQRLCKIFSLLWLTVGAFPGLSSSTRSCCTLSGKPNPLHDLSDRMLLGLRVSLQDSKRYPVLGLNSLSTALGIRGEKSKESRPSAFPKQPICPQGIEGTWLLGNALVYFSWILGGRNVKSD